MAKTLGLAKFGENFANTALRTYFLGKQSQRADEASKRAQEKHDIEVDTLKAEAPVRRARAEEELEGLEHQRGARQLAQVASEEYDALQPTTARPRTLDQASEVVAPDAGGGEAGATMPAAEAAQPAKAKHFYIAEKVADYHRSKGRNEDATKVLTKAYTDAIAENEARYNFELLPKVQKYREMGLDRDALKADKEYQQLQWDLYQTSVNNLGHIYGLLKTGNKADAIRAFNASGVVMPGVKVDDVRIVEGKDGAPFVVALDKDGKPVNDKEGKALARPQAWFERVWNLAQQQTIKVGKGDRLIQATKQPDGTIKTTELVGAHDPEDARKARNDDLARDKAWSEAINKSRDDAGKYLKDTLGLTANALGQVMNPDNQPVYERALPIVTEKLQAARAAGKKLDSLDGVAIAKEALKEARDAVKREKLGAGPRNPGAAARRSPTVADIIGGGAK